jgi:4,5-DOPA dioxygenase extradiol
MENMMTSMPTVFVSHGAPTMAIQPGEAGAALQALAPDVPRPSAILMVSAHWETQAPVVSTAAQPETIHDFGGFPEQLYRIRYPAPGAPALAQRTKALLDAGGFPTVLDPGRGLDHGAWVPLLFLYPDADVPVTQLSIQPHLSPVHHYRVGEALRALTHEGVLIVASGSLTHNLREFRGRPGAVEPYVRTFQQWMKTAIEANDVAALLDYRRLAPDAVRAHPTDEHLLPLFVALGAAHARENVRRITDEVTFGVIAMDTYVFGMPPHAAAGPENAARLAGQRN